MAPNPNQILDENLRSTIHHLFTIQSSTHGYQGPATQRALLQTITNYHSSLQTIHSSAPTLSDRSIPPEIIQYIDEARNPDVYTREFVELTQKGNRYLASKAGAFAKMRDALAAGMVGEWPEMREVVGRIIRGEGEGLDGLEVFEGGGNASRKIGDDGNGRSADNSTLVETQETAAGGSTQTNASMHVPS